MNGKRGAPEGNQNARKHGYYSSVLDNTEQQEFQEAKAIYGLDDEIALLRVKIKSLTERDPDNIRLILQAVNTLERVLVARYNIRKEDKKGVLDAVGNVLKNIALPLGISIASILEELRK